MSSNKDNAQYELILTIVNRGFSDAVMDAAKAAGARGGTVLLARGTSSDERKFFGMTIQPEKEVVMILAPTDKKRDIMLAIGTGAGLTSEGRGISFSLPVDDIVGIVRMNNENAQD